MEFDNAFEVPLPPDRAWPVLMNVQGIAPCMPGAQLTEVVDDKSYKGNIAVRLGPVALTFAGLVTFEEIDNTNHTARVRAQHSTSAGWPVSSWGKAAWRGRMPSKRRPAFSSTRADARFAGWHSA